MSDLERIELIARRTASHYAAQRDHDGDLIANAFEWFASELLSSRVGAEDEEAS